jgi:hypothetical protein
MHIRIILLAFVCGILSFMSCKEDVTPVPEYESFTYSTEDADAGTWKTIHLQSATQVAVPAPSDPASAEYLAELSALKAMSANLNAGQQDQIGYWSTNGVVRWNEIARELVAKYFIFPMPNPDGTYPLPNGAKPDQYPLFPLSTPPYAVRAYAYLGAGTYDALVAAWHYKYQYDRKAPSTYDVTISTHLPVQNIPAYPSEDAVVAAFSRTLLTFLFPNEAAYLRQQAEAHTNSRMWAGLNVQSDISAGDSLGRAIADLFIVRAKGDKMGATLGNQAVWDSITTAQTATGNPLWKSMETPARPMLAPNFGHVKPWTITSAEVYGTYRLPPPPAVGTSEFQTALDEVLHYSKNASKTEQHIAFRWDDGTSTYSPPGHWNYIASPYIHKAHLNPLRATRIFAYLNMAMQDASICVWDSKYYYFYPRPTNVNPDIKTILPIPNFPSYPSGHSGFSSAGATVLGHFFPADAGYFASQAREAALSRLYGCIHYRFDCEDGLTLGENVAKKAVELAQGDGGE